jgi:hypothetical protein
LLSMPTMRSTSRPPDSTRGSEVFRSGSGPRCRDLRQRPLLQTGRDPATWRPNRPPPALGPCNASTKAPRIRRRPETFPDRTDYRLSLANARIGAGDYFGGVAAAEDLSAMKKPDPDLIYNCACVLSLAAAAPNNPNAKSHSGRAVALLRRSFKEGFLDVAHLLVDTDLDALRHCSDYADLLWDLADWPPIPVQSTNPPSHSPPAGEK